MVVTTTVSSTSNNTVTINYVFHKRLGHTSEQDTVGVN
jgi:hypothetical protein